MPQRKRGSRAAGLHIPGIYEALLGYERARYERRGGEPVLIDGREIGKKVPAGVDELGKEGFFMYPRRDALNSLEAGAMMNVSVVLLEDAVWRRDREQDSSAPRPRLPFGRSSQRVRVSPDDRLVAVAKLDCHGEE